MPLDHVEQPPAEIVGFEQMAKPAHRGFVGHRLVPQINPNKAARRLRIIDRLLSTARSDRLNHCCRK